MNCVLTISYLTSLAIFAALRPQWRRIGPSLLDSFVIGISLFAIGSVIVFFEGLTDSETVMRIGLLAALSGTLAASLWGYLLRSRITQLDFFGAARGCCASRSDQFAITTGLIISSLVSLAFLAAILSQDHIRSLLFGAFLGGGTLNEARIVVSSGAEGYFAPGYVKQFRDIIVPILCVAAILCGGTCRRRGLFYAALLVALATVFVSGQRLVIVQYMFCLGTAFLIDRSSTRARFASPAIAVVLMLLMLGSVGLMTQMLGRLDVALSPLAAAEKEKLIGNLVISVEVKRGVDANLLQELEEKAKILRSSGSLAELKRIQKERDDIRNDLNNSEQALEKLKRGVLPNEFSGTLVSMGVPAPVASAIALLHRAVIAVPRENTVSYSFWSGRPHSWGAGWNTDMSGIAFGTQNALSNDLSMVLSQEGRREGNSPLGLATDVFYNWGWVGVGIVPALYALGFLLLDIFLISENSPLTYAAKIFLFFSVPLMYSPFMFILYGGVVAISMGVYTLLARKSNLAFFA